MFTRSIDSNIQSARVTLTFEHSAVNGYTSYTHDRVYILAKFVSSYDRPFCRT